MNTEQERTAFEVWAEKRGVWPRLTHEEIFSAGYQAGRAALQSQDHPNRQGRVMDKLFCDLKTDEEKAAFFLSGRGYETGVISQAIQNDVAMAYHRCVEYKKELEALQSQDREDAERLEWLVENMGRVDIDEGHRGWFVLERDTTNYLVEDCKTFREAIDHARRIEGEGK